MFRLTREVRLNVSPDPANGGKNGHAGTPAVDRAFYFVTVRVTLIGEPDVASSYVRNIKDIDDRVQAIGLPYLRRQLFTGSAGYEAMTRGLFDQLIDAWPGCRLDELVLLPSASTAFSVFAEEPAMMCLSQRFEFSAAHRLHNADLGPDENRRLFGKCNNPLGHGHNYEVQVTLRSAGGPFPAMAEFERLVDQHAITKLDHKNLNQEVDAFAAVNPSVEQIAKVIYHWLKPPMAIGEASLASVTVWETPRTWCEYHE